MVHDVPGYVSESTWGTLFVNIKFLRQRMREKSDYSSSHEITSVPEAVKAIGR